MAQPQTLPLADQIVFEHPLTEKCRTLLRLSNLFEQFEFHMPQSDTWGTRAAMSALLDLASVLSRADIKSELIKELERFSTSLRHMANQDGVDTVRLEQILRDIELCQAQLANCSGQLGNSLRKNEFLTSVLQRSAMPGGSFDFDLPQYHYWLRLPHNERLMQMDAWRQEVAHVQESVDLVLSLIRGSTTPTTEVAKQGLYQQTLPGQGCVHMVRVALDANLGIYPETSGGKHRFNIRFLNADDVEHPQRIEHDVPFQLTICAI